MRTICVVITARASYARIKSLLSAIQLHPDLELTIVAINIVTQYFSSPLSSQIKADGFSVNHEISCEPPDDTLSYAAFTTAQIVSGLTHFFLAVKPHVVVTIADRFETMSTAIAASYVNIPLAHIQGGEVSGNIDEKVRHAITKLADVHFVATPLAKQRVIRMGECPDKVFLTGCPSVDLVYDLIQNERNNAANERMDKGCDQSTISAWKYILVLQHSVTTYPDLAREQMRITLSAANRIGLPIICFCPNTDPGSRGIAEVLGNPVAATKSADIRFFGNVTPEYFLKLLMHCSCLVGNSSVGIRESSCMGIPVVNIGSRQNGRERGGNVVDVGYDEDAIACAIYDQTSRIRYPGNFLYGRGQAGQRIAEILAKIPLSFTKTLTY